MCRAGTSFSDLQATVQAWQPIHFLWSITKPNFIDYWSGRVEDDLSMLNFRDATIWRVTFLSSHFMLVKLAVTASQFRDEGMTLSESSDAVGYFAPGLF